MLTMVGRGEISGERLFCLFGLCCRSTGQLEIFPTKMYLISAYIGPFSKFPKEKFFNIWYVQAALNVEGGSLLFNMQIFA